MSLLSNIRQRVERGAEQIQDRLEQRLGGDSAVPVVPKDQDIQMEGAIPNPLGDGRLLNVQIAISTHEDAGSEHTKIRARINAPILQVLAPSYAPRITQESIADSELPAVVRNLPGASKFAKRAIALRKELSANLPTTVETGEELSTVLEMDIKRARSLTSSFVQRLKERTEMLVGPEQWQMETTEQATPDGGFRALMTMRGENRDGSQGPVNVEARMGVEYKRR